MEEQNNQQKKPIEVKKQEQKSEGAGSKDVQENKAITFLSYIGLLFLVPLLAKRESKFAQSHAKQGLVLTIGWFLGSFLYMFFGLGFLVHLFVIILSIMGLVNVGNGKMKDLPLIGDIAKKFNI